MITNYSTSPFPEEMYERIKEMLTEYGVVITRWPQYTLVLENVSFYVVIVRVTTKSACAQEFACMSMYKYSPYMNVCFFIFSC